MLSDLDELFSCYDLNKVICIVKHISNNMSKFTGYWHPLGFVIIKLLKTSSIEYRLHIWPNNKRKPKKPNWPIHNHRFNLESLVLKGIIGSEKIELTNPSDDSNIYELYSVNYCENGSEIIKTNIKTSIKHKTLMITKAGKKYTVKKGDFHQSCVNLDTFSASLVRTSEVEMQTQPLIVGQQGMSKQYSCPMLSVNKDELKVYLEQIKC